MEDTHKHPDVIKPLAKATTRSRPSTKTLLFHSSPCSGAAIEAHALKNCLSVLDAAAQLLHEELTGRERERALRLKAELDRLRGLLLHRLPAESRFSGEAPPVDAHALVEGVCARLRDRAELKGVSLAVRVRCGAVLVHREPFSEAMFNLIENAIEATSEGEVAIDVHQGEGGDVLFQVRDGGRGMSRDSLAKLGSPVPGDGDRLGVQLASAVVERHGGLLHFESELGVGTTATIWVPSCAQSSQADIAV